MRKIFFFFFVLPGFLSAQHDFDSLFQNSNEFRRQVEVMGDTLDLFGSDIPLNLTIVSDFKTLISNKYNGEYQKAVFIMDFNDTVKLKREIKIKPRGNYRLGNCYFPPLMLNFKKDEAYLKTLKEFDKIKMVNNCKMEGGYEKYIIAEYLVYKLYNEVTPFSFRVRLINLKYIDTGRENKESNSYAFIIEPVDQLMSRLNGVVLEKKGINHKMVDRDYENKMAIFQYMVGNTDYSIPALHNIKVFKSNDFTIESSYPIPYDFDYAGIINTPYAVPNENLPITDVKERLFMGACQTEEIFRANLRFFNDKKDQFINLINDESNLDQKFKSQMIYYLESFYQNSANEIFIKRSFLSACKQ